MSAQDWEIAPAIRRETRQAGMPVPKEKLTIDGEYEGITLRNPAEDPDTCRIAWFAWWAVQGMNPSPCSRSRLVGSELSRVYGGASRESRQYLFALCLARPDDSVSRAAASLDQRRPPFVSGGAVSGG